MKNYAILFLLFFNLTLSLAQSDAGFIGETINFKADDGITVTADLYMEHESDAPFIILYHQAGYSRGEYREIAPKLNALGFNCMAVDQRSGDQVNGVINQTHKEALAANKPTKYLDALPDIEAAYLYVKFSVKPEKLYYGVAPILLRLCFIWEVNITIIFLASLVLLPENILKSMVKI